MLQSYINILVIFGLIFLGYFFSYRQWFSNETADIFSKMVLNLGLPCSMFLNITANFTKEEFITLISGTLIPFISIFLTFFISKVIIHLFKLPKNHHGTFSTMFTCSNTIFIGLPINLAVFGEKAVPYVLLYYIVNTSFFWTIGIFEIAKDSAIREQATLSFHPLIFLKKLLTPALLGFIIGIIWIFFNWTVPNGLVTLGTYLGNLTTPLSMFAIGIMLYYQGLSTLRQSKESILVLFGRFVLSPIIIYVLTQFISVPHLMMLVFMVQSSMPVQNSVPLLARNYQADEIFAATTMSLSVFVYLFFIPILLFIIQFV